MQSEAEGEEAEEGEQLVSNPLYCSLKDVCLIKTRGSWDFWAFFFFLQCIHNLLAFFLMARFVELRNWHTVSFCPQEHLDGEEADFRHRAWGKGIPALPNSRRPFVPLLPVAMVTREQDPSLLFSINPKEGGHTSANGTEQRGLNISLQSLQSLKILFRVIFGLIYEEDCQGPNWFSFTVILSSLAPRLQDYSVCFACVL